MLPNTTVALVFIAGAVAALVRVWFARRESKRLERQVDEMRRRVEAKRRELEVERKRAEWKERTWRKFGGEWR